MMVKVCGITRREDALVAAEAGASAIGFIFYPQSPRYIAPERAAALGEGLDVWKVGIFVDEAPAAIEDVMRAAHLDVAQIYGGGVPAGARVWRAVRVDRFVRRLARRGRRGRVSRQREERSVVRLEAGPRTQAQRSSSREGWMLPTWPRPSHAAKPWGVDASSKLESAPGIKDHDKVRAFVKAAREATW